MDSHEYNNAFRNYFPLFSGHPLMLLLSEILAPRDWVYTSTIQTTTMMIKLAMKIVDAIRNQIKLDSQVSYTEFVSALENAGSWTKIYSC